MFARRHNNAASKAQSAKAASLARLKPGIIRASFKARFIKAESARVAGVPRIVGKDVDAGAAAERIGVERRGYRRCKRVFDVVFSAGVLILFSWLFAAVAIAIKLEDPRGSVVFKQKRIGRNGREFQMYKFRSMATDAEDRLEELKACNEKAGPVFKIAEDPRTTRVGRVIRKVSVDELPQFVNVLRGDLSVVGPRPALPVEVAAYTPYQRQRLLVDQGLTCYWQTRWNRDSITFDEWIELDLLYIEKRGFVSDIKLIVKTVGIVFAAQGS